MGDGEPHAAAPTGDTAGTRTRRRAWIVGAALALAIFVVSGSLWLLNPPRPAASAPSPSVSASRTPSPAPAPTPTPVGHPVNTASYDVSTLPQVNVFAVVPALLVDDAPLAAPTDERALPVGTGAPVWSDPAGEPVAHLPREFSFDGTTVPVIEKQEHWIKVLLMGRQAMPSQGNPAQVVGWLRTQDVEITSETTSVVVSISARTVDIVSGGVPERVASDFAWGTDATPTPVGRTYIMTTRVVPEYGYTRGHPIVYLAVQSPTLDGFGGADVAVTAFHYHDERSGPVSNGCIRLAPEAIDRLAQLPLGTPVLITP